MKRFHSSAIKASVALLATLCAWQTVSAESLQNLDSSQAIFTKDQPMLAEAGAKAKKTKASAWKVNVDKSGVILKGYDAVAYFKQQKAVKGNPKYSSKYHGATYYFASAADKTEFDKTPAKYAPQYGGFCAHGVLEGRLHDSDPNVFWIYNGKLYVCENEKVGKAFYSKPEINIQKADKNWEIYEPPSNPGFQRYLGS
jgi:YHS domain-containing protein